MLVQLCLCQTYSETTLLVFPRGSSFVMLFSPFKNIRLGDQHVCLVCKCHVGHIKRNLQLLFEEHCNSIMTECAPSTDTCVLSLVE